MKINDFTEVEQLLLIRIIAIKIEQNDTPGQTKLLLKELSQFLKSDVYFVVQLTALFLENILSSYGQAGSDAVNEMVQEMGINGKVLEDMRELPFEDLLTTVLRLTQSIATPKELITAPFAVEIYLDEKMKGL